MKKSKRLMIIAGGTGGHVFPGLTISHYLINHGWEVNWIGTSNHIEAKLVPKYGIKIDFISIIGLYNKNIKTLLSLPIYILNAWWKACSIIKNFQPNIVLGMGGYVSGPGCLAAWSLGIPVFLHEQNSIAGLTNKLLGKIANKVLQAFPTNAFSNAEVVGNPIRIDILNLVKPEIRLKNRKGPLRILVIGGSQGAQIFNQIIPKVAKKFKNRIIIWHQSGEKFQESVKQAYFDIDKQEKHRVTGFIINMAEAYNWADIVICRSGALTVSEIAASGLPAIFVPFQHKDRQQYWNALPLEKVGAAKIFTQSKFTVDEIYSTLSNLDRKMLLTMAVRARSLAIQDSTERIAQKINQFYNKNCY